MTVNEQERVLIYRRIVDECQNKNSGIYLLKNCSDEQLLEIINSAVLPNSISLDALKNSYLFNMLYSSRKNKATINKSLSNIEELINTMQNTEKLFMNFIFNGYSAFLSKFPI